MCSKMKFRLEWIFAIRSFEELQMFDYQVFELVGRYTAPCSHAEGFNYPAQRIIRDAGLFDQVVGIWEHPKRQEILQERKTSQGFRSRACQCPTVIRAFFKDSLAMF